MNFGENLRMYREKAGLTMRDLAKRVYVTDSMICAIENGQKHPSLMLGLALAHELGTTVETLAGFNVE